MDLPFKSGIRSLANRISLVLACLLALAGAGLGVSIYAKVKSSLLNDLKTRCMSRISELDSSLEIHDGVVILEDNPVPLGSADAWQVVTLDGVELWSSHWENSEHDFVSQVGALTIGDD